MKILLATIIALHSVLAYANKTELTYDALIAYSALTDTNVESQNKKMRGLLREQDIRGYIASAKDSELRKKQLAELQHKLEQQFGYLKTRPVVNTYKVNVVSYDPSSRLLRFSQPISNYQETVGSLQNHGQVFPQFFFIIFSNGWLLEQAVELSPSVARKYQQYLQSGYPMYLQVSHQVVKLRQDKNILTAITAIRLYANKQMDDLVYQQEIKSTPKSLVENSFYAEGVSNPLVGIHSFRFYGMRLLDRLVESSKMRKLCSRDGHVGVHQKLVCLLPYYISDTESVELRLEYVGGVLATMQLYAVMPLSATAKRAVINSIRNDLGVSEALLMSLPVYKWSKYRVDFSFYGERLNAIANAEITPSSKRKQLLMELHPHAMQTIYKQAEAADEKP